jgi:hypothetical protein
MSRIIVASAAGISIRALSDIADLLAAVFGADGLILSEQDLGPAFFDLRSGLAGEVLQKLTNYRVKTALVLPDPSAYGQRFSELAYEHASHNLIRFVRTEAEARAWLGME